MADEGFQDVKVLVVDDEEDIRRLVAMNLRRAGFAVVEAADGQEALDVARAEQPAIVVLDVMMPGIQGTEVARVLRADRNLADAYILMLTARGEEEDRVAGFQVGADDYVTKPFSVKELVLRVKAAARRLGRRDEDRARGELVRGRLRIDPAAHRAWVKEHELELTATEYRLLLYLAERPGILCTRGELLEKVWELPPTLNTRTVDTHIKRLRQKLGAAAEHIETVRGAGYRFREVSG